MRGIEEAQDYMKRIRGVVGRHIICIDGLYYGRRGHLRLAREIGHSFPDFDKDGQNEILHCSYSTIYVIGCNLKPILNAGEWIDEMEKGAEQARLRET